MFYDDKKEVEEAIQKNDRLKFLKKRSSTNRADPYYLIKQKETEATQNMGVLNPNAVKKNRGINYRDSGEYGAVSGGGELQVADRMSLN